MMFQLNTLRNLSDCNWTRTQNHLVRNELSGSGWVRVQLQSLKLQISGLLRARSSLTLRQLWSLDSLWNVYVTWQEHTIKKFSDVFTPVRTDNYNNCLTIGIFPQCFKTAEVLPAYKKDKPRGKN